MKNLLAATAVAALMCAPIAHAQQATFPTASGSLLSTPVSVPNGGSGNTSLAVGSLNTGNGTGAYVAVAPAASGTVLTSNGSGAAPSYQTPPTGTGRMIKLGTLSGGANFDITTDQTIALTGTASTLILGAEFSGCTGSGFSSAEGGFYTGASQSGVELFGSAGTTAFGGITTANASWIGATGASSTANTRTVVFSGSSTLYLHFQNPSGVTANCTSVEIFGLDLT